MFEAPTGGFLYFNLSCAIEQIFDTYVFLTRLLQREIAAISPDYTTISAACKSFHRCFFPLFHYLNHFDSAQCRAYIPTVAINSGYCSLIEWQSKVVMSYAWVKILQSTYLDLELEAAILFDQIIPKPGVEDHGKEDGQIDC